MKRDKKIVGLWQDSAATQEMKEQTPVDSEALGNTSISETDASAGRDWLDTSALTKDEGTVNHSDVEISVSPRRGQGAPILLILLAVAWISFAFFVATDSLTRLPSTDGWPGLIATLSMPLTLLVIVWLIISQSARSTQVRFVRAAAMLREENAALNQSMHSLSLHLADAQKQLADQAKLIQQLGIDTVTRLTDSSDKLASNASIIANANDQLARSGDVAMQRMDGLLAGLPRIDDVAQRLAVNFREAGLVAHQQGASLEAKLAALGEEASRIAETSETSIANLQEAIDGLQQKTRDTEAEFLAASSQIADAHDTAWERITKSASAAREDMVATVANLGTRMDALWQTFRAGVDAASEQMEARLGAARSAGDEIGAQLEAHGSAGEALAAHITNQVEDIEKQLDMLDGNIATRAEAINRAIGDTKAQLATFTEEVGSGNKSAQQLVGHADSLLLALDAVTRELDETLPRAFERVASHGKTTEGTLAQLRPMLEASELVAQSTLSHVNAVKAAQELNDERMTQHGERQQKLIDQINTALADADAALAKLRSGADEFAEQGGARMIATLEDVRSTAESATEEARHTLAKLVADARESMQSTATKAVDAAFKTEVLSQLNAIEEASQRAVAAANGAADRLMRQLITIMDTSVNVEKRALEVEKAIAASDRETLAKQAGLLTEALKSTAIDVTKILSTEVSDTAWEAYLKGDRGVFARRAVKLVGNSEAKEILRLYQTDDNFHAAVNQFIHDFEAMLRLLMGARDGSAISVTLLSSDIGKLYVALAQAIDRLRS